MDVEQLVQADRVHRRVYNDTEIFELEIEKIFSVAWIYIGHVSQVQNPGDFYCTDIALQPVVMTRHSDGEIKVLFNRCGHRGAQVIRPENGSSETYRCCYHGWEYDTDGTLIAVPRPRGYEKSAVQPGDPAYGMTHVPRMAEYRGFVFASLSPTGPTLEEFLGPIATSIDDLVDRAPDGEIEVAGGVARHLYQGNWKLVFENLCDGLHPNCVHQSSIEAANQQDDTTYSDGAGEIGVRQMRQNGAPWEFWEDQVGLWAYRFGHSYLGDYHDDAKLVAARNDSSFDDYYAAMEAAKGNARTQEILGVMRWNTNIYPTISFMSQFRQLRVIRPVSVDQTEVLGFCFRLKGAPEKMFHDTIRFANITNAVASPVLTDDLETYDRIRRGLMTDGNDWIATSRGLGGDAPDEDGGWCAENGLSELHIRNMFDAWSHYMTD
ncbi:MAG: ribosomal subunit interface protein [Rhodospirillaceae bacterium]|nr:ribosomal subunit interface protein [Rhodospirillaceae bacterium]|tara:strand:+ start:17179 stop:18483 length:1305 start_codon:yes stop_codon:yes gene_type:complete